MSMNSRFRTAAPSIVTAAGMLLGFSSIAVAASGRVETAAWLIVYCTFLDKADGSLARILGVSSRFGMEMDSYSDFTSFGIAPAALLWFSLYDTAAVPIWWVAFASLTWVLMTAVRLARFNVDDCADTDCFSGVPTTLAAGVFASLFLTLERAGLVTAWGSSLIPLFLALGILMVGRLRIPKIKPRKSRAFNLFQYSMILLALAIAVARVLPEALLALSSGYLVIGGLVGNRTPSSIDDEAG
ncbi:MAG: hypothetical protein GXP54_05635 [Deltaproteobacteria bacterium]|nr:hypothetical protein [Deltaproteobacteria bacterium]